MTRWWGYFTYCVIHAGKGHLIFNLGLQVVVGLGLEAVHGTLRVAALYIVGVREVVLFYPPLGYRQLPGLLLLRLRHHGGGQRRPLLPHRRQLLHLHPQLEGGRGNILHKVRLAGIGYQPAFAGFGPKKHLTHVEENWGGS